MRVALVLTARRSADVCFLFTSASRNQTATVLSAILASILVAILATIFTGQVEKLSVRLRFDLFWFETALVVHYFGVHFWEMKKCQR